MTKKWAKLYENNLHVDEKLLNSLQQIASIAKASPVKVKSSGFAINHPLDSSLFRETIREVNQKPSVEYINSITNSIRY